MTRSRVLYGFVLAFAVIFLFSYNGRAAYIFLYGVLALLVFSFISVNASRFFIQIQQSLEKQFVFKGEDLNYTVTIHNRSIFSYPLVRFAFNGEDYANYKLGQELSLSLPPGQEVRESYTINFKYRGVYPVGVKAVIAVDFLGLFSMRYTLKDENTIIVYPSRDELLILPFQGELLNKTVSNFDMYQDNYADMTDVRKYEPSDDYRKVHWKLTAKKNEFMVKNYQATVLNKTMIFLESNSTGLKGINATIFEDALVAKVASVVYFCTKNNMPAELVYGASYTDKIYVAGLEDMNNLHYLLAQLRFDGRESISPLLEKSMNGEEGFFNIILLLYHMNSRVFEAIRSLQVFGHSFIIYYFVAGTARVERETKELLDALALMGAEIVIESVEGIK